MEAGLVHSPNIKKTEPRLSTKPAENPNTVGMKLMPKLLIDPPILVHSSGPPINFGNPWKAIMVAPMTNLIISKPISIFEFRIKQRYTITSALPYANGPLHIGHLAGAYIPGDIFVRFLRLNQKDVVYVCGSDEHGAAITIKAKKEGVTPQEIIDKYNLQIKESFEQFGISFNIYHRTSEPIHHQLSQEFFLNLYEKGEFIERFSEQYYDEEFHQFLADRYIVGTCPHCHNEGAYGDQCEKCGTSLNPTDLINPKSTLSGKTPILKETKHWYLPLDKYQPWLEKWLIEGKKNELKSNVFGQCQSWLKSGLQPRSMTRDLDWGVDVPLEEAEGKKLYVWLDAPIGYISATKQWAIDEGKNWEDYWKKQSNPENDSTLIHFIGKDNIVFHCIIFPAILHAHGEYILPENVPANEFLNLEGDKLSTSRNHAVWLHEYLEEFPGKQDELRTCNSATVSNIKGSKVPPPISLMIWPPACTLALATSARKVSTEINASGNSLLIPSITGMALSISSCADISFAPGRLEYAPRSMISAPSESKRSVCRKASSKP
ncbi:UNVERIFIED_CONTAM: metG [Trichonephila clavipes]